MLLMVVIISLSLFVVNRAKRSESPDRHIPLKQMKSISTQYDKIDSVIEDQLSLQRKYITQLGTVTTIDEFKLLMTSFSVEMKKISDTMIEITGETNGSRMSAPPESVQKKMKEMQKVSAEFKKAVENAQLRINSVTVKP